MSNYVMPVYNRLKVNFTHGKGAWLWDADDKQYLDALAGIAVCNLGHAHPDITLVIQDQASKLLHCSNGYEIQYQQLLAEKLCQAADMKQAFFGNSGAEANECAIKLARFYGHQHGNKNPQIIVMETAFHGRTLANISASAGRKIQAGFEPLVQGFIRAPYNDINALKQIADSSQEIVAVMFEPIQGGGGVHVPTADYISQVKALCEQHGWLLILDEIQTGMGRTGALFNYLHTPARPDIVTTAKALGNGIPIGATMVGEHLVDMFGPGNHGSTFGGNPFACRVALTVLETLLNNNIIENAKQRGAQLKQALTKELSGIETLVEIRGQGLMLGIEFNQSCRELLAIGLEHGLLFNAAGEKVIRILPPLIIDESETIEIAKRFRRCVESWLG